MIAVLVLAWVLSSTLYGSVEHDPLERLRPVGGEPAPILFFDPDTGRWSRDVLVERAIRGGYLQSGPVKALANRGLSAQDILKGAR